jgi:hypothetical protein
VTLPIPTQKLARSAMTDERRKTISGSWIGVHAVAQRFRRDGVFGGSIMLKRIKSAMLKHKRH